MPPSRSHHRLIYLLNVAQRRVQHWASDADGEAMTATQAGVVFLLGQAGGMLISDIGRALALNASSTTGLIDRMAAAGLVERRSDDRDGRAVRIFLSPQGSAARQEAKKRVVEINDRLVEGFTADELSIVARWLAQAGERFSKESKHERPSQNL